jgi:methylmalonyl-CoA/ethylmalonyl-CoA epimerase
MDSLLAFHHIGVACRDIAKTKELYLAMGYKDFPVVEDPVQHVRVCFLENESAPRIELLEPLDQESPVSRTLSMVGVSPYHLCYEVKDIEEAINRLRARRFILVNGPVEAPAMDGRRIAFLFNKNNGLIEIVENPSR